MKPLKRKHWPVRIKRFFDLKNTKKSNSIQIEIGEVKDEHENSPETENNNAVKATCFSQTFQP